MLAGTTSTPEKDLRLSSLYSLLRAANHQNARLQARLKEKAATYGETLDAETDSDLKKIMDEHFQTVVTIMRLIPLQVFLATTKEGCNCQVSTINAMASADDQVVSAHATHIQWWV